MSITIDKELTDEKVYSAYRRQEYQVTSDDADIVRMKCKVHYDVSDQDGNRTNNTVTIELDPDLGTSDQFTLDIQILKNDLLSYRGVDAGGADIVALRTTNTENAVVSQAHKSITEIQKVEFTELLSDGTTGTTSTSSNQPFLIDAIMDYTEQGDGKDSFLANDDYYFMKTRFKTTTNPSSATSIDPANYTFKEVGDAEDEFVGVQGHINQWDGIKFSLRFYDSDGNDLSGKKTIKIDGAKYTATFAIKFPRIDIGVGPKQLEQSITVPSDAVYYLVWMESDNFSFDADDAPYLMPFEIVSYNNCETTRFHFVNQYGALDAWTFTGKHLEGLQVSSQQYERILDESYTIQTRGTTELHIRRNDMKKVWSDVLTKDNARYLKQLKASPLVWVQDDNQNLIPVIIINKDEWSVDSESNIQRVPVEYVEIEKPVQRG